jgi:hypothetical protein
MTKREAAVVSAYTGFLLGNFSDMHEYIEKIMGRPVWTHELGSKEVFDKIKELATEDFMKLEVV